jgi:hypothetical protein
MNPVTLGDARIEEITKLDLGLVNLVAASALEF